RFWTVYYCFAPSQSGREKVRKEISEHFGVDSRVRSMIMAESVHDDGSLNERTILGISITLTITACCVIFMFYAIHSIFALLKVAKLVSQTTIRQQKQLFLTICLQTFIPFLALYLSCGPVIILPLFDLHARWVADLAPLLISFFLPLDALAVLISMTEYRREVARLIFHPHNHVVAPFPLLHSLSLISLSFL
ncbi:hypothetical protein PMAYCL1PPCAC_14791, partial [Pristionchus mayeri]